VWALALLALAGAAQAHPLAPALLELKEEAGGQVAVTWRTSALRVPGARIVPRLPEGCTPLSEVAIHEEGARIVSEWRVDCGGPLVGREVGVEGLETGKIDALVRVVLADGRLVQGIVRAGEPVLTVPARPGRWDVFADYAGLGTDHILTGLDHLLFVFGLLLLCDSTRLLVETVTAFTVGHSITLSLAVLDAVHVPSGPADLAIAASILVLAVELARDRHRPTLMRRFPWVMALLFGLLHGLGFAGALREVGLPSGEIPLALFSFNVGIEVGQLIFVAAVLIVWRLTAGLVAGAPGWLARAPVYVMGSLAAFWMFQRIAALG
jgi:hydrogenase/urease accessory protein HupE